MWTLGFDANPFAASGRLPSSDPLQARANLAVVTSFAVSRQAASWAALKAARVPPQRSQPTLMHHVYSVQFLKKPKPDVHPVSPCMHCS